MYFSLFIHYAACIVTLMAGASMSFDSANQSEAMAAFLIILGSSAVQCVAVFSIFTLEYRRCYFGWFRSIFSAFVLTAALAGSAWVGLSDLSAWIGNQVVGVFGDVIGSSTGFVAALIGVLFVAIFVKLPSWSTKVFASTPFVLASFLVMVGTVGPYARDWSFGL